jgi:hypothetical protein
VDEAILAGAAVDGVASQLLRQDVDAGAAAKDVVAGTSLKSVVQAIAEQADRIAAEKHRILHPGLERIVDLGADFVDAAAFQLYGPVAVAVDGVSVVIGAP